MPQPPFQTDAIAIEPGSSTFGARLISRFAGDGSMQISDPSVSVVLSQLVGIRNVDGIYIVGRGGDGAPYTTIQDALDAVPGTSSASLPSLIWVLPGQYTEDVTIEKDGVILVGNGARLVNASAGDTVTVAASIDTTPSLAVIQGLEIECTDPASACIRVNGADSFASGAVTVNTAPLVAGDTLTIGGTVLTGTVSTRTPGSNDFQVTGGTTAAVAAEIAAAVNDVANSLATTVRATVVGPVITLTAVTSGSAGNTLSLASSTTPAGGLTLSGATFTGGGASGSLVASDTLRVEGCVLKATGAGSYQIHADVSGNIHVMGGTWWGSASGSSCNIANCTSFRVFGVDWVNDFNLSYDSSTDQPVDASSSYRVGGCGRANDFIVNLVGTGSLDIHEVGVVGDITAGGDQSLEVHGVKVGNVILSDTLTATLSHTVRGTAAVGGGSPTLQESRLVGSVAFVGSASESVVFPVPHPDASYQVLLDSPTNASILGVTSRSSTGFTIDASAPITGSVGYVVIRDL